MAAPDQELLQVTNNRNKSFGVSIIGTQEKGFTVQAIALDGLAASAGLKQGDKLWSVNNVVVTGQDALFKQLRELPDRTTVTFGVLRASPAGATTTVIMPVAPPPKMVPHPLAPQEMEKYWGDQTNCFLCVMCLLNPILCLAPAYCYVSKSACFEDSADAGPCDVRLKDVMVTEEEAKQILEDHARAQAEAQAALSAPKAGTLKLTVANDNTKSFGIGLTSSKISSVSPSGLGAAAGLHVGDELLSVNGGVVKDQDVLFKILREVPHRTTVIFSVSRSR